MPDYLAKVKAVRERIASTQRAFDLQQRVMRLDTVASRFVELIVTLPPEELGKYQASFGRRTIAEIERLIGDATRVLTEPAYKVGKSCLPYNWRMADPSVGISKENEEARSQYEEWRDPDL